MAPLRGRSRATRPSWPGGRGKIKGLEVENGEGSEGNRVHLPVVWGEISRPPRIPAPLLRRLLGPQDSARTAPQKGVIILSKLVGEHSTKAILDDDLALSYHSPTRNERIIRRHHKGRSPAWNALPRLGA